MQRAFLFVQEQGNRHAPAALAGDAPIGTILNHAVNTRLPPVRNPGHLFDFVERPGAQASLVHTDKPLRRGAENNRRLVAPAVRVAVLQRLFMQQRTALLQHFNHMRISLEHMLAGKQLCVRQKLAITADRVVDFEFVATADHIVVLPVTGGGVHTAGAGFGRDMLAKNNWHLAHIKRVLQHHTFQVAASHRGDHAVVADAPAQHGTFEQRLGQQQAFLVRAIRLHYDIFQLRMHGHGTIGRERPRRGGPDHQRQRAMAVLADHVLHTREQRGLIGNGETHIDGRRGLVLILYFRFGQGRAAVDAPMHRLVTLVDMAIGHNAPELTQDVGLNLEIHREVRLIPVTQYSETLEVFTLAVHLFGGILAAGLAERGRIGFLTSLANLFFHLQFNWQAVAIPARHIGRVITRE